MLLFAQIDMIAHMEAGLRTNVSFPTVPFVNLRALTLGACQDALVADAREFEPAVS